MLLGLILTLGFESPLMRSRSLVLQSAGYFVASASSVKEAIDRFLCGDFDLVLLNESVPAKDKDLLIRLIRESGSRIPIVPIAEVGDAFSTSATAAPADGPTQFLNAIKNVLMEAENLYARRRAVDPCAFCPLKYHEMLFPERSVESDAKGGQSSPSVSTLDGAAISCGPRFRSHSFPSSRSY